MYIDSIKYQLVKDGVWKEGLYVDGEIILDLNCNVVEGQVYNIERVFGCNVNTDSVFFKSMIENMRKIIIARERE